MDRNKLAVQSQITFLYYRDLAPAARFYGEIMGFELVEDQSWAKIYRVGGNAFLGIVDEARGFHKAQDRNAVLVTLAVDDVAGWHEYLQRQGVKLLTEVREFEDIQVQCFFLEDPGGYAIKVEEFLKPEAARIFHQP